MGDDDSIFFDDSDDPGWVEFRRKNRESGVFVSGPWEPDPAFVKKPKAITFDDYQNTSVRTFPKFPRWDLLAMGGLGVAGEAGEVADSIKKHLFQGHTLDRDAVAEELGDVLWYVNAVATVLHLSLNDIALGNIAKLNGRYPDGFEPERSRDRSDVSDG